MIAPTAALTLPTWITIARLGAVPIVLVALTLAGDGGRTVALVVFLLAAATDWLDGYLARRLQLQSELGKFLDPLADKLLTIAPLLWCVQVGQVPAWGVFAIVAREMAIAAWRGAPSADRPSVVGANLWGKLKTIAQMAAVVWLLCQWPGATAVFWVAVGATLLSGMTYVWPVRHP